MVVQRCEGHCEDRRTVVSEVILYVAGFSYTNNPAGKQGQEFQASPSGSSQDEVWYQVDTNVFAEALFGETIRKAYLDRAARASLDDLGVTYQTRESVEACGMSNYVLWLKPNG
jgi:hypothetical protein